MSVRWMAWAWTQTCRSPGAKLTLMALADHAGDDGRCFPGSARLAEKTGQSPATVRRHLNWLEESKMMTRERRRRDDGTLGTYDYQLLQRAESPIGDDRTSPARTGARAEPSEEPSDVGDDPGFEQFWAVYGRVGPKKAARAAYDRARTKADHAEIMTGLDRWVCYWAQPGSANVKWPQGWLNEERWKDSPPPLRTPRTIGRQQSSMDAIERLRKGGAS